MGLISWVMQLFGWRTSRQSLPSTQHHFDGSNSVQEPDSIVKHSPSDRSPHPANHRSQTRPEKAARSIRTRVRLTKTRRDRHSSSQFEQKIAYVETSGTLPYRYARYGSQSDHYLDLSRDGDDARLIQFGLPVLHTPAEVADWLGLPLNQIAWLIHRFSAGRSLCEEEAHYHYHWVKKRQGGWRLIEAPKAILKRVQHQILHQLVEPIPVHSKAHGFTPKRSIVSNATPHVDQEVLLKLDLANFYTTVSFSRVVAIFRSIGYSREAAIWLGMLTTTAAPGNLAFQEQGPYALTPYLRRHLPQGAPTSPALANLSAFSLDVRLSGLAKSFGANYTRYADDLTFSGSAEFGRSLRTIIPLIEQIIREERFTVNKSKRKVLRSHQRQVVTGVIVNQKPNISRFQYDQLKAILTNCVRFGPSTQNRQQVENFSQHLRGCVAHVKMLNANRGEKLLELFQQIDWSK